MKKHTLIENIKLDPHTYLVTIGTDMGQFTGAAECREEDWKYESEYFGFELAERKAEIEYARAKKNHYRAQVKALKEFLSDMAGTRTYDVEMFWVKKLVQRIEDLEYSECWWRERVRELKVAYRYAILAFDEAAQKRNRGNA